METVLKGYGGMGQIVRGAVVGLLIWQMGFSPGPGNAASIEVIFGSGLDPETKTKVEAALTKINEPPVNLAAVETLLSVEPRVAETVGTSRMLSSSDAVVGQALNWCQSLQSPEVLVASLEKGSNTAVHWALRQIVWRTGNGWFDKETVARLMPGIESALVKAAPATRAQAVRTMMVCLPRGRYERISQRFAQGST
jgi:hypothetical protein